MAMGKGDAGLAHISRRRPKQERAKETVRAILHAAAEQFARHGYAGATTNRIARRAGVSIGSLYQYFSNKDAILAALLQRHHEEVDEVVHRSAAILFDNKVPVEEGFRFLLRALVELHDADPNLAKALSDDEVSKVHEKQGEQDSDALMVEKLLRSRPDVRSGNYGEMAQVISRTTNRLTRWLVHESPDNLDREVLIEEIVLLLTRYVS